MMEIAHVDLKTGEIKGCEPGTYKWYHEQGHIEFDKQFSGFKVLVDHLFYLWIIVVTISLFLPLIKNISLIIVGVLVTTYFYEEWWCNQYAKKQLNLNNYEVANN